jgi:hypothetical protein
MWYPLKTETQTPFSRCLSCMSIWLYLGDCEICDSPSSILVLCELTSSRSKLTQATRAGHQFVPSRIRFYKSKGYLGAHVGTRGLVKLPDMKVKMKRDEKKILRAWDCLRQNHPLIKQANVDEPSDLMNSTENVIDQGPESKEHRSVKKSGFRAWHRGPVNTSSLKKADARIT